MDLETISRHSTWDWHVFGVEVWLDLLWLMPFIAERVKSLILQVNFLGAPRRFWYFPVRREFYPEAFALFRDFNPQEEQDDLVAPTIAGWLGKSGSTVKKPWNVERLGRICYYSKAKFPAPDAELAPADRSLGLLEAHYYNKMFWGEDNYILNRAHLTKIFLCQFSMAVGDVDCRPSSLR